MKIKIKPKDAYIAGRFDERSKKEITDGDYILCSECKEKLIYDKPIYTYKYHTNREWWQDRFGEELKMICPNCREKEDERSTEEDLGNTR